MADFQKTLSTPDGQRRAVILRRPDGFFGIAFEHYDDTVVSGIGAMSDPFWRPEGKDAVAPSLGEAEAIAVRELGLGQEA